MNSTAKKPKKTNEDVDQAVEDSFPASDPPSYNPGSAAPASEDSDEEDKGERPEQRRK